MNILKARKRLELMKLLIDETEEEINKVDNYYSVVKKAKEEKKGTWEYDYEQPSGQRIKENMKMIRRNATEIVKDGWSRWQ